MPKLGMEPIRRAALVKATIEEIGAHGSLDVTVARIAPDTCHELFNRADRPFKQLHEAAAIPHEQTCHAKRCIPRRSLSLK